MLVQLHNCSHSWQKQCCRESFSRLEFSPKKANSLNPGRHPNKAYRTNAQSAGVSEEEHIFYTEDDDETKKQIWQKKKEARNSPTNQMPDISFETFTTHNNNYDKLSNSQKFSNTNIVAIEQNIDIILQQLKLKLLKEEYSESILLQDTRYQYCSG